MAKDYPIMLTEDKIPAMLDKISKASTPKKFTYRFLASLGFASSNDRAFVNLLKELGFIDASGVPTGYYDELRNVISAKNVLAQRVKSLYDALFLIDSAIYDAPSDFIKNAISNVTGMNEENSLQATRTFLRLCSLSNFDYLPHVSESNSNSTIKASKLDSVTYNININLPETTNPQVYETILRILSEFKNLP
ncbi:MAG: DUF5343 domain-containing protein [Patescibacteria group bacterium]